MSPRKRIRSSKSTPSKDYHIASNSMSPKSPLSPTFAVEPLTGAAAVVDEQRARTEDVRSTMKETSPNPARKTIEDLLAASSPPVSKAYNQMASSPPLNIPAATASMSSSTNPGLAAPNSEIANDSEHLEGRESAVREKTPIYNASNISKTAPVASPGPVEEQNHEMHTAPNGRKRVGSTDALEDDARSNRAFTFPGPGSSGVHRTSSLPQPHLGRDNTSPATKRHKCPFCNADFTRYHNLKSHLLTHSQEKPYSCDKCESSFRRLHDLKRHTKLHTGERPHVCPKCDRSFARGDALARHNKGQGGCAGRRESTDSFAGDDHPDDAGRAHDSDYMTGIKYTSEVSQEPEQAYDELENPASRSLPSIKGVEPQRRLSDHQNLFAARPHSTYPPVPSRSQPSTSLYPPAPSLNNVSGTAASSVTAATSGLHSYAASSTASSAFASANSNVFQGGMTESPKPLSPGAPTIPQHLAAAGEPTSVRALSPNHHHSGPTQQQYRARTGSNTSPSMSLPAPQPTNSMQPAPHLPPLQGLHASEGRFNLPGQVATSSQISATASTGLKGAPPGPSSPKYPSTSSSSTNNTLSIHAMASQGGPERASVQGPSIERMWAYIDGLSQKINRLEDEVESLKHQANAQSAIR